MRFSSVRLAVRRSSFSLGVALALATLTLSSAAGAQTYTVTQQPIVYEELPIGGGPVTSLSGGQMFGGDSAIFEVQVTLPFPVNFFGTPETNLFVSANGFVTLGTTFHATSTTPRAIPGSASPHNLVAVWWDSIVCDSEFSGIVNGPVLTQEIGAAPNRTFVVQWTKCRKYASSGAWFNAQLWFFEGSNRIEARYGDAVPGTSTEFTAAMGIENSTGTDGTPGLSAQGTVCNPTCKAQDFPAQTALVYTAGPTLQVGSFTGDDVGAPDLPLHATAVVENVGGADALGVDARFWLSDGPTLSPSAILLSTEPAVDVLSGSSATFDLDVTLPASLADGAWWLIVEVDTAGAAGPSPILGVWGPISVAVASPDLAVTSVLVPARIDEGQTLDLQWTARNLGMVAATDAAWTVTLLSSNLVGPTWPLDAGSFDLEPGETRNMQATLSVPEDVAGGRYYVRVDLDPDQTSGDVIRQNNRKTSQAFVIASELLVVTSSLPVAQTEEPFSVALEAVGGDGAYAWSVAPGSALPPGLVLESKTADETSLAGTPQQSGTFQFTLQVASLGMTSQATFSLVVIEKLRVTTVDLPEATVGTAYSATLVATGGTAPYVWSIVDGELPPGLELSEDGVVSGTPEAEFDGDVTVRVEDDEGRIATRELPLFVGSRSGVVCTATGPAQGLVIGAAASGFTLDASGGKAPYRWSTLKSVRLADDRAEAISRSGEAPPGLEVAADGTVSGSPSESGSYDWTLRVTDDRDKTASCVVRIAVEADRSLSLDPEELPAAEVASRYEVKLQTDAVGWYAFSLGAGSTLPAGLTLNGTGTLSGTPTREQLLGAAEKSFTFEVRVMDAAYRVGSRTFTLVITDPDAKPNPGGNGGSGSKGGKKKGGCQSAGGEMGFAGLVVVGGIALLRRRS